MMQILYHYQEMCKVRSTSFWSEMQVNFTFELLVPFYFHRLEMNL